MDKGSNQKDPSRKCDQNLVAYWIGVEMKMTQVQHMIELWSQFGWGLQPKQNKFSLQPKFDCHKLD